MTENYFPSLRSLLTAPEAKTFFNNFAELAPLSSRLLTDLEAPNASVASVLTRHLPTFSGPYGKCVAGQQCTLAPSLIRKTEATNLSPTLTDIDIVAACLVLTSGMRPYGFPGTVRGCQQRRPCTRKRFSRRNFLNLRPPLCTSTSRH